MDRKALHKSNRMTHTTIKETTQTKYYGNTKQKSQYKHKSVVMQIKKCNNTNKKIYANKKNNRI